VNGLIRTPVDITTGKSLITHGKEGWKEWLFTARNVWDMIIPCGENTRVLSV
jgi:hypothetical protein